MTDWSVIVNFPLDGGSHMGVTGAGEVRAALKVLSVAVAIPQMRGWLLEARPSRHLLAERATHSTVILRENGESSTGSREIDRDRALCAIALQTVMVH